VPAVSGADGLSPKQRIFVQEYIIDLNATQAAIRAGYSENSAKEIGCQLLTKLNIKAAVQEAMDLRSKRLEITADRVLAEIGKLAFSNTQDLYDEDGNLIPIQDLPKDVAATIQEITQKTLGDEEDALVFERKYKTADKKSSLELLGKHLVLFTDKIEHGGTLEVTKIEREIIE
jgi:phage terminase small subunit